MKTHHFLTLNVKLSQASESSLLYLMPPTQDVNYSRYGRTHAKEKKTGAERLRCADEAVALFPKPAGEASIILFPSFQLQPAQTAQTHCTGNSDTLFQFLGVTYNSWCPQRWCLPG